MTMQCDVVVIGAGMVGLALALGLRRCGLSVQVVEQMPSPDLLAADHRVSALNLASERVLRHLGVWEPIAEKQRYQQMSIWEQDSSSRLSFSAAELCLPALGYIVPNQAVMKAMYLALQDSGVVMRYGCKSARIHAHDEGVEIEFPQETLRASWLISAEGAHSRVRADFNFPTLEWDYGQSAVVATIATDLPHQACARQVFLTSGPLALLPLAEPHLCSIVWSVPSAQAHTLLALNEEAFSHRLSAATGMELGLCRLVSPRQSFALRARYARDLLRARCLLVGDAAHTIHPLAGQGVNLGLMDAAAVIEAVEKQVQQGNWNGCLDFLAPTLRWRKTEAMQMLAAMEGIKQLFAYRGPFRLVRRIGIDALQHAPIIKRQLALLATGNCGELPLMARGS